MPLPQILHPALLVAVFSATLSPVALAGQTDSLVVKFFPATGSSGVNPDTHLVIGFPSAPMLGKSGFIRIYDTSTGQLVDTLDLGIPAGPDPHGPRAPTPTLSPAEAEARAAQTQARAAAPLGHLTNANAVAGTSVNYPTPSRDYQLTIIGGVTQGFHFYPVIIHGNVATIYPHNNLLDYHRSYRVEIDPGVLTTADGSFKGIDRDAGWTFTTKAAPPAAGTRRVLVAADGTGDFNTVQGALDFVPDDPAQRVTIFIKNGTYEEIVFFHDKNNLTLRGEDRTKVQIGYGNNSVFNPPTSQPDAAGHVLGGPSRRCAFACYNSTGIVLSNFTVSNYYTGQAEGLLISGSKNIVSQVTINGSGDALNLKGSVYLTDSRLKGDGDTILGVGPAFFDHCELASRGPYMWVRNPAANHGNVFVDCTFETRAGPSPTGRAPNPVLARLPNNHGINYPYAEAVLIDCRLKGITPEGWGPIADDTSHLHFWEYHSTNLEDGKPVDVSKRHPVSRQLSLPQDADVLANYRNPSYVLGGWTPVVDR